MKGLSSRKAAAKWNVKATTLLRFKKNPDHKFHHNHPVILSEIEEDVLYEWVQLCTDRGYPRSNTDITDAALTLLENRLGKPADTPGPNWLRRFKKRKNLSNRTPQSLSYASGCISKPDVLAWYERVHEQLNAEGFSDLLKDPARIFNCDESCFLLNPSVGRAIAPRGTKNVFELIKDEKYGVTVLLTIRADGKKMRSFIIYKGTRVPAGVREKFPHEKADAATSDSGWMTSQTFCLSMKLLAEQSKEDGVKMPDEKIILFVDNHTSHITFDSCNTANELGIILIGLYPNSTFLTQPCDVACFKPLKNLWRKEVRMAKRKCPDKSVSRADFALLCMQALDRLDSKCISNGFKRCGIFPWDPQAVNYSKCLGQSSSIILEGKRHRR